MARSAPSVGQVFALFLKLGATAFGGLAMVTYIRDQTVRRRQWLSEQSFQDGVVLCQSLPGATVMQVAAYVGLRTRGILGALAAYVGFALPAFVLMVVLSHFYGQGQNVQQVVAAFRGLQVIVITLMANAAVTFARGSIRSWADGILAVGVAALMGFGVPPLIAIGVAAALGLLVCRRSIPLAPESTSIRGDDSRRALGHAIGLVALIAAGLLLLAFLSGRLFSLATLMLKVDTLAFGGAFASMPLMLHEVVDLRKWMDAKTFMDGIALGQVTPGPILITATFIGYQVAGLIGAIVGTIAIFSPSFIYIILLTPHFDRLQRSRSFRAAVQGASLAFVGILLVTSIRLGTSVSWNLRAAVLAGAAFAVLQLGADFLWVVVVGTVAGVLLL
ncbi:MAG: chromate efflux transporter [Bacillota bacterium]